MRVLQFIVFQLKATGVANVAYKYWQLTPKGMEETTRRPNQTIAINTGIKRIERR
jgi:hypothetical protein